jgi:hypothetical protein
MKWMRPAFALAALLAGCSSSASTKNIVGTYSVTITYQGISDPDTMTVKPGTNGTVLFTFTAGITTDATGPNPDGLRATLSSPTDFKIAPQPATVDHSTGMLTGTLAAEGTIAADGSVMGTLHFAPMTGSGIKDADGGFIPLPDGGGGVMLDYSLSGMRQ